MLQPFVLQEAFKKQQLLPPPVLTPGKHAQAAELLLINIEFEASLQISQCAAP